MAMQLLPLIPFLCSRYYLWQVVKDCHTSYHIFPTDDRRRVLWMSLHPRAAMVNKIQYHPHSSSPASARASVAGKSKKKKRHKKQHVSRKNESWTSCLQSTHKSQWLQRQRHHSSLSSLTLMSSAFIQVKSCGSDLEHEYYRTRQWTTSQ